MYDFERMRGYEATEMTTRRNVIAMAAGGGLSALASSAWGWSMKSPAGLHKTADPRLAHVHPQLRVAAEASLQGDAVEFSETSLPMLRRAKPSLATSNRSDISVERRLVPGLTGEPDVVVFVINANPGALRGAILHTHGGGYVTGSAEMSIRGMQDVAAALDCVIVTVEYRLAPETRWAGSLADNYAGLRWLHSHAKELGADPERIAVMGESAGGGHAALLALTARDRGEVPLLFQCLTYPMLDDRTGSTQLTPSHVGNLFWTASSNRFGWSAFLGVAAGSDEVPTIAVPGRRNNLEGLPPAFIGVGDIDLFVGEDMAYAARLRDAGVPTQLEIVPGAFHGFEVICDSAKISQDFIAVRLAALRTAFAGPGPNSKAEISPGRV